MADNIDIPGFGSIPLPEWAKDSTLRELALVLRKNADVVDVIQDLMDDATVDVGNIATKMSGLANQDEALHQEYVNQSKNQAKEFGRRLSGVADKFNDTSKPLTTAVNLAGDIASGAKELSESSGFTDKVKAAAAKKLGGALDVFGGALGIAGDGISVWAGFMAARGEQFAEAQNNMIDAGAIMFDSAQAFEDLRGAAFDAGITYLKFGEIVANFGPAMTALGGNTSKGAVAFARMTEKLNESSDQFGDFGMTNDELSEGFAAYIETQRLTGNIDRSQAGYGDKLVQGYQKLLIETGSFASATAFSRKQLLDAQREGSSQVDFAGATQILERMGDEGTAQVARDIQTQLFALKDPKSGLPGLGDPLADVFGKALIAAAGNKDEFSMEEFMMSNGYGDLLKALQDSGSTIIGDIESAIRTGGIENSKTFLFDAAAALSDNIETSKVASGAMDGPLGTLRRLQAEAIKYARGVEEARGMSEDERKAKEEEYKKGVGEAGKMTTSLNNMQEGFLKAQDMLTMNMSTFAAGVNKVTNFLNEDPDKEKTLTYGIGGDPSLDETAWIDQREKGGPVEKNIPYIVGEAGPEVFVPNEDGTIIPNNMIDNKLSNLEEVFQNFSAIQSQAEQYSQLFKDSSFVSTETTGYIDELSKNILASFKSIDPVSSYTDDNTDRFNVEDFFLNNGFNIDEFSSLLSSYTDDGDNIETSKVASSAMGGSLDVLRRSQAETAKYAQGVESVNFATSNLNIEPAITEELDNMVALKQVQSKEKTYESDENNEESSLQNLENQLQLTKQLKTLIDNWASNSQNRRILDTMFS